MEQHHLTPEEQEQLLALAHKEMATWTPNYNPTPKEIRQEFRRCLKLAEYKLFGKQVL